MKKNKKYIYIFLLLVTAFLCGDYYFRFINYPVDVVYLWVDGSDPNWIKKKNYWQEKMGITALYAVSPTRWRDRNELLYSLRSVSKYMPWVRKIFIVTDNQIPKWLNTENSKIVVVDHKDILPSDALPVFNSSAIETGIPYIKGLSEHFIYFNDDVFVNMPLSKGFFFNKKGQPIFYSDNRKDTHLQLNQKRDETKITESNVDKIQDIRIQMVYNTFFAAIKKIDFDFSKVNGVTGTHTTAAYLKSTFIKANTLFSDEVNRTAHSKFRAGTDVFRNIVYYYDVAFGNIEIRDAADVKKYGCDISGLLIMDNMKDLIDLNPCTFCLNDYPNITTDINNAHINYLKQNFPEKSEFEK